MCGGRQARVFYLPVAAEREGNTYEYFFTVSTESGRRNPSPDPAAFKNGYADTIYENRYISGKRRMCKFCSNGTPILKSAVHSF